MRRPTAAVAGTLAGAALLAGLKFGASGTTAADATVAAGGVPAAPDPGVAAPPPVPPPVSKPSASASPGRTRRTAAPTRSRAPRTTTTPRPSASSTRGTGGTGGSGGSGGTASGLKNGTFAGAPSTNEYGTIGITITVSGGKLTNVKATYPTSPSRTAQINQRAIPVLRQEALAAQNARIATVSGATFTSSSYRASLQSALNAARA